MLNLKSNPDLNPENSQEKPKQNQRLSGKAESIEELNIEKTQAENEIKFKSLIERVEFSQQELIETADQDQAVLNRFKNLAEANEKGNLSSEDLENFLSQH